MNSSATTVPVTSQQAINPLVQAAQNNSHSIVTLNFRNQNLDCKTRYTQENVQQSQAPPSNQRLFNHFILGQQQPPN